MINLEKNIIDRKISGKFGVLLYEDGTIYSGYFSNLQNSNNNAKPDKHGKITHISGETYQGEISLSRITGYGTFVNFAAAEYKGYWQNETQHGYGIESWNDGSKFTGLFDEGKKILGIYNWKDGSYYEGEFLDNNFNGFVRIFYNHFLTFLNINHKFNSS
jgi:hypothetical protein